MLALKVAVGVVIGAGFGVLLGRSKVCSRTGCEVRNNRIASLIAGAVVGGVAAYFVATR